MLVEISPGDLAGVMTCVVARAEQLRLLGGDYVDQARDLMRVATDLREALAADGRQLPEVPAGEAGSYATCPSCGEELYARVSAVDYRRNAEWAPDGSVILGKCDSTDNGSEPDVLCCPQGCGDYAMPDVADYR